MKKNQQGFTLIELMIVVAIIGILAAVAIPAYKDYIARSQATEGAVLLSGLKAPLAEQYQDTSSLAIPSGSVTSGKYINNITASSNVYTATFNTGIAPQLSGKTMTLTYNTSTGAFTFGCSSIPANVRPKNCP